jgi:hypothetical protein
MFFIGRIYHAADTRWLGIVYIAAAQRHAPGDEDMNMPNESYANLRRAYLRAFLHGLRLSWPVLSAFLVFNAGLGAIVGLIEGWGVGKGIYFAFVTGLTIGYGDLVPTRAVTQVLAILIGLSGILLTALLAAVAVRAFQVISEKKKDS